jgi:UDP-N-acetylmuramoylalanine--D-glutamate ligase
MLKLPYAKGKIYGVVGLGKSGRATVAALLQSGADVYAWDDKESTRESLKKDFPLLQISKPQSWPWESMSSLVMSPGIPLFHPALNPIVALARKAGVEVIGDIELLYRAAPEAKYVAITGTNGKSTTTTLIGHILKQAGKRVEVGGNLGRPVMEFETKGIEAYVLELSSYQLDLIRTLKLDVAVWLNISPDHIDHHGSMEAYVEAKRNIFARQGKRDVAVVAVDDATSAQMCKELQAGRKQSVIPVSAKQALKSGVFAQGGMIANTFGLSEARGDITRVKSLQGEHNGQNAAAAYAACYAMGVPHDIILAAMQTYPGLAHRMQWLGEIRGVAFVNDSKATNADAAEKALRTYDDIYWIAGGVAKEGGIEPLEPYFKKIRHAYLIGEASDAFAKTLEGKVPYTQCGTLDKAFAAAVKDAKKGAVVLAPACASFDQYANFEVRGDAFMKLVEEYRAA